MGYGLVSSCSSIQALATSAPGPKLALSSCPQGHRGLSCPWSSIQTHHRNITVNTQLYDIIIYNCIQTHTEI